MGGAVNISGEKIMEALKRLEAMIANAYALAVQVQDDNRDENVLQSLAEEVSGECSEFLALLNNDMGSFGDPDCIDPELVALVEHLNK
jgi:hypothetical protein